MAYDREQLTLLPSKPGVYLMKNSKGKVLYVGKAKNLKQRVRHYFLKKGDGRQSIPFLMQQVSEIETIVVRSEKEAFILENTLIKKHQPKYNVLLKDDKSYIAISVNRSHEWPMVQIVRHRGKSKKGDLYFGPYTNAFAARQMVDLINRLFPLRQCSDQEFAKRTRPCILYGMKRCIAPCVGYCSKEEYDNHLKRTIQFLRGQDKQVLKNLYHEMEQQSQALEFEKAATTLKVIKQIEATMQAQHVDIPNAADCDALGLYREGGEVVISLLIFRGGKLVGATHHHFSNSLQESETIVESFILQNYHPGSDIPKEIVTPMPLLSSCYIVEQLEELGATKVSLIHPKRGKRSAMVEMAADNAKAAFHKQKDQKAIAESLLLTLQERFHLMNYPRRIECFDNSNLSGSEPVSSMVAFTDGEKDSKRYRTYKIKGASKSDDYGAMEEVLMRRLTRAKDENDLPDLLIVDGGKGQLNAARKILKELNIINVDLIALTKEEGRHDQGATAERVFLPDVKDPIHFKRNSPVLFFLQRIRDEAHRVAISFHRKRRSKETIKSALDSIPGIGRAKKQALLRHFGSVKAIKEAERQTLTEVKGISSKNAEDIIKYLS